MLMRSATSRNIFAIALCGMLATLTASGVLFREAYLDLKQGSIDQMDAIVTDTAKDIRASVGAPIMLVNTMERALATAHIGGQPDRAQADLLLKNLLVANPVVLGTWTGWEPEAFDGKDKDFVGKEGHDDTGRYVPYWVRGADKIIHTPLVDYTKDGAGDYYQKPFKEKRLVIIEPYIYPVDGKDVLMTSITRPVMIDEKPVGVAGIDMSLDATHAKLEAIHPMGDGWVGLVTAAGNIVNHPDAKLIGKTLKDMPDKGEAWAKLIANPETTLTLTGDDGQSILAMAHPVDFGEGNVWYVISGIPEKTVFADLNAMARNAMIIMVCAALMLAVAGWLIARRFIARIEGVIADTNRIASGETGVVLKDADRQDELGDLARSLAILQENAKRRLQLEAEGEQGRAEQERERAERARIASAQEADVKFAVSELGSGLSRLSNGDMTVRLDKPFTGVLEEIRGDFNLSVEKLQEALLSFSENARTIESGSTEIRRAADDLARRTEHQAASVEETAAALEEITTSVKDSTARAEEAGKLVGHTRDSAEKSGAVVRDAVDAMSAIEQSSQSISNIIGVIDDIAFQTNLLALNAGVEAARAGEAGKGFAVVAQEVRELAQRSANAAKEIKGLILSSGEQVKRGVSLVDQTGDALQHIVAEVQRIDQNVQAIVSAAREQSTGLQEINSAVNQMDQVTQQNAGMVEETNAAAHTLVSEVTELSERLGQFNLGGQRYVTQAARAATSSPSSSAKGGTARASAPVSRPATPSPAPAPVKAHAAPVSSPARALGSRVATAFAAAPKASAAEDNWEEF